MENFKYYKFNAVSTHQNNFIMTFHFHWYIFKAFLSRYFLFQISAEPANIYISTIISTGKLI